MYRRFLAIIVGGSIFLLATEHTVWARGFGGYGSYATSTGASPYAYGNYGGRLNASRFAYTSPARANPDLGSLLSVPDAPAVGPNSLQLELLNRYDRAGRDLSPRMGGFLEGYGVPVKLGVKEAERQAGTAGEPGEDGTRGPGTGGVPGLPSDGGLHLVGSGSGMTGGGGAANRDLHRVSAAQSSAQAAAVRRSWYPREMYSEEWYRSFPIAWSPSAWALGKAWSSATWDSIAAWIVPTASKPVEYRYGDNVVFRDDTVYVDARKVGTGEEYYQQAQSLAAAGARAQVADGEPWLPLGVFSMSHQEQTKPTMILQLAIDKAGILRGNYTNTAANQTLPIRGSVDKQTQRAAWAIGDNANNVVETGIYSLTQDQAPALLHFGKDRTEQWLLVRLRKDDAHSSPSSR